MYITKSSLQSKHTVALTFFRPSNLLSLGRQIFCKYSHLNTDLACQSIPEEFRCLVLTGTVKKGISLVLLPCLNFVL